MRVKAALAVAKKRGKKLGAHNSKVKGKGGKARRAKALALARALVPKTKGLVKRGNGARKVCASLNSDAKALATNGSKFYLSKVQRILKNQKLLKLL